MTLTNYENVTAAYNDWLLGDKKMPLSVIYNENNELTVSEILKEGKKPFGLLMKTTETEFVIPFVRDVCLGEKLELPELDEESICKYSLSIFIIGKFMQTKDMWRPNIASFYELDLRLDFLGFRDNNLLAITQDKEWYSCGYCDEYGNEQGYYMDKWGIILKDTNIIYPIYPGKTPKIFWAFTLK